MKSRLSFKRREPFATSCVPIGARASAMKIGRREIPGSIAVFIRGWVARRAGTIAGRLERGNQHYVAQPFLKGMRQGAPPSIAIFAPGALRSSARVWSRYFRPWPRSADRTAAAPAVSPDEVRDTRAAPVWRGD
jgi:hypothetical protein